MAASTTPAGTTWEVRARNDARCRRIVETASSLVVDDLDWEAIARSSVDPQVLDCLVYMRDVEGFTDRDLVGFTAHRSTLADPLIRRFLDIWRAEEAGHTRALDRFLTGYAEGRDITLPARQAPPAATAPLLERVVARIGGPVGTVITTAHMAWGAANELLTLNGYRLLADRCEHPTLTTLLRRIAAQEARHYTFYLLQAEWRLAASRTARAVLPRILQGSWTPVGVGDGYKSAAEFDSVLRFLAQGDDGRRAFTRMDARFASLPGFDRLRIYEDAAATMR